MREMLMDDRAVGGPRALARDVARRSARRFAAWLVRRVAAVPRDRGDVPGWVLVTLMTAGLVLALWAIAGPALTGVFTDAISRVTGTIGG